MIIWCRTITQLTGLVVPPRQQRPIALQRERSAAASRDLHDTATPTKPRDLHRRRVIRRRRTITQLTRLIVPPRQDRSITLQCQRMRMARRERDHTATGPQTGHPNRRQLIRRCRPVAQLTRGVLAPRENPAIGTHREAERIAGRDHLHGPETCDRDRSRAIGRRAITELTGSIVAPGHDRVVAEQREPVLLTDRHGRGGAEADRRHRKLPRRRRAVRDLTGLIVSPPVRAGARGARHNHIGAEHTDHTRERRGKDRAFSRATQPGPSNSRRHHLTTVLRVRDAAVGSQRELALAVVRNGLKRLGIFASTTLSQA